VFTEARHPGNGTRHNTANEQFVDRLRRYYLWIELHAVVSLSASSASDSAIVLHAHPTPSKFSLPRQTMVLRIGQHASGRGQTVGIVVHGRNLGDVPDVLVTKAMFTQALDVFQVALSGTPGDFHRVVEHGQGASLQAGTVVVEQDALGRDRVTEQHAHRVAV